MLGNPLASLRSQRIKPLVLFTIVFHVFVALLAPLLPLASTDAQDSGSLLQGPSLEHWLGTDSLGRDVFSRLLHGGRPSLLIAVIATLISALTGIVIGSLSALAGGWLDDALSRLRG